MSSSGLPDGAARVIRAHRMWIRSVSEGLALLDHRIRTLRQTDEVVKLRGRLRELRNHLAGTPFVRTGTSEPCEQGSQGTLAFKCNVCGTFNKRLVRALQREEPSCDGCSSTVRFRGVVHALSTSLFGDSLVLAEFPHRPDIIGLGMSDWEGYAAPLSRRLGYTNTFYHREPLLDITKVPDTQAGQLDFLISSDVFEHVSPPIRSALANARQLLKPDGVLIVTVPYGLQTETIEHFPNLHDWSIVGDGLERQLVNVTADGVREVFERLVFHGGAGSTLEMRVFSQGGLLADLAAAGFSRVEVRSDSCFEHGVYWWLPWSLPIVARP